MVSSIFHVVKFVLIWISVGVLAALILMGLFRFYDKLPYALARPLKILTLSPPLILAVLGMVIFISLRPWHMHVYMILGLLVLAAFGLWGTFSNVENPVKKRLIRDSLLAAIILPFASVVLFLAAILFQAKTKHFFHIQNHRGHEIVLKEVYVNDESLLGAELVLQSRPDPSSPTDVVWRKTIKKWLKKPKRLSLLIYDPQLKQEVRGELKLMKDSKGFGCDYDIVYGPEGFQDRAICDYKNF